MKSELLLCGLAIIASACSSGTSQLVRGPATDTPPAFLMVGSDSGGNQPVNPDAACENPLVDPRSGTKLTLVRSQDGLGDYEPETPRYELSGDELLRIDCSTGAPVGRVAR